MKKANASKDIRVAADEQRVLGAEPTFVPGKYTRADVIAALNWYNYVVQDRDRLSQIPVDYVTERYGEDAITALKALPWWRVTNRMLAFPRMGKRGYEILDNEQERLDKEYRTCIDTGRALIAQASQKKPAVVVSLTPKQIEKRAYDAAIADLDVEIDRLTTSKFKYAFSTAKWFKERKLTPGAAKKVAKFYDPLVTELELAVSKKDAQVNEGYSHLKPAQKAKLLEFVKAIRDQAQAIADTETDEAEEGATPKSAKKKAAAPKEKKPRAKKAVDPKKLVSKLKYMLRDSETKLESVDPSKIHGASEVWLYNAKYRELTYYKGDKGSLSLKGQTLIGFTESELKKIRKPETLASMMEGTPKATYNAFAALKTASRTNNPGRINPHVLILRVVK